MDLWDYLKGLRRWWWMLLVFPATAFAVASVIVPAATWDVRWTTGIVFNGDPDAADNANALDSVVLDDMALLLESGVVGDRVYLSLPEEMTSLYSRDDIGELFEAFRHGRFVEITVSADDPETARTVSEATRTVLPEAINLYLIPPDFTRIPAHVSVTTLPSEPKLQTRARLIKVGGITMAGTIAGLAAAGITEWVRMSYSAKYDPR